MVCQYPVSGFDADAELFCQYQMTDQLCCVGDLKKQCETNIGVVSQCCLTKHVFKMSKQYLANVALKINVKVGTHFSLCCIWSQISIHGGSRQKLLTQIVVNILLCLNYAVHALF
jgi:hypothetical protein